MMSSTVTQSMTGRFCCQVQRNPWLAASIVKDRSLNFSNTFFIVALIIFYRVCGVKTHTVGLFSSMTENSPGHTCPFPGWSAVWSVKRFSGCGPLSLREQPLCLGSCSPPFLRQWHHISDSSTSPELQGTLMNQWLCRSADLLHSSSSVPVFISRYECWRTFRTSWPQGFKLKIYWSWTLDPMIDMVLINNDDDYYLQVSFGDGFLLHSELKILHLPVKHTNTRWSRHSTDKTTL